MEVRIGVQRFQFSLGENLIDGGGLLILVIFFIDLHFRKPDTFFIPIE
jgi:hypothetical protein